MTRFAILAVVIAASTASAFANSTYVYNDKNRPIRVATPVALTTAAPQAAAPKAQSTPNALTGQTAPVAVRHTNDKNRPI